MDVPILLVGIAVGALVMFVAMRRRSKLTPTAATPTPREVVVPSIDAVLGHHSDSVAKRLAAAASAEAHAQEMRRWYESIIGQVIRPMFEAYAAKLNAAGHRAQIVDTPHRTSLIRLEVASGLDKRSGSMDVYFRYSSQDNLTLFGETEPRALGEGASAFLHVWPSRVDPKEIEVTIVKFISSVLR